MTCKTGFEFTVLVSLGFQARTWRPWRESCWAPLCRPGLGSASLLFPSISLCPSCTERGLVHTCGHSRLHLQALFIPIVKAIPSPPFRLRGAQSRAQSSQLGADEEEAEQVLEINSRLSGQGRPDSPLLELFWEACGFLLALVLWPHRLFLLWSCPMEWGSRRGPPQPDQKAIKVM